MSKPPTLRDADPEAMRRMAQDWKNKELPSHTAEPWRADIRNFPGAAMPAVVADGKFLALNLTAANAHRIAACVNACAGIPTEALEAGAVKELVEALWRVAKGQCPATVSGYADCQESWRKAMGGALPQEEQEKRYCASCVARAALAKVAPKGGVRP